MYAKLVAALLAVVGGFALGGSVELGAGFRSSLDACGTYLVAPEKTFDLELDRGYHQQLVQPRLRLMVDYRLAQHFGAFVGVAALGQIRSELGWDRVTASVGPESAAVWVTVDGVMGSQAATRRSNMMTPSLRPPPDIPRRGEQNDLSKMQILRKH